MNEVILIKFHMNYEPNSDIIAVAPNMEVAKKYAEKLKIDFPDLYPHGKFIFKPSGFVIE